MTRRRARSHDDRGQATVELALVLPLLVVLLLAILQIGLLGRDLVLVTHASREAARAAAVDPDPGAAVAAARAAGGLAEERLTVMVTGGGDAGSRVQATVTYRARTEVPLIGALVGDRTIRSSTTMRVEGPAPSRVLRPPQASVAGQIGHGRRAGG
jgi:Flp pilus assembly protein TadG